MITTFIIDHVRKSDYHFWNALYFIFRSETVRGDQILHPSMMVQNSQIFKVCLSSLFHQNEVGNLRLNMKLFSIWYLCAKIMQSQNEFSSLENGYQKVHFFMFVSAHCPDATSPQAHPNHFLSFTTKRRQKLSESIWNHLYFICRSATGAHCQILSCQVTRKASIYV